MTTHVTYYSKSYSKQYSEILNTKHTGSVLPNCFNLHSPVRLWDYRRNICKFERFHQRKLHRILRNIWQDLITNKWIPLRANMENLEILITRYRLQDTLPEFQASAYWKKIFSVFASGKRPSEAPHHGIKDHLKNTLARRGTDDLRDGSCRKNH